MFENCGHLLSAADVEPKVYAEKLFYDLRFGNATQTAKVRPSLLGFYLLKVKQSVCVNRYSGADACCAREHGESVPY